MASKKKHQPRNKEKNVTFNTQRQVANRRDLLEVDYVSKLNDSEKDWLNRFNEEFALANFNHSGKKLDKSKKAKKAAYDSNNARNRCLYNKAKSTGLLDNAPSEAYLAAKIDANNVATPSEIEDALLTAMELKNLASKLIKPKK